MNRAPQALDLLLDRGANVEGGDDGAQPARGGDRLQAGHAGAEDEDVGRRDRAGGGHHHRHRPVVLDRRIEHRLVAGEVALRAERIHALGARDAGQELERHGGQPARRVGGHQAGLGGGREEADQQGALLHQADLVRLGERRLDLEHHVGAVEHRGLALGDGGPGLGERRVAEVGAGAGAGLKANFGATGDQLLDGVGRGGDAALVLAPLPGDGDFHAGGAKRCAEVWTRGLTPRRFRARTAPRGRRSPWTSRPPTSSVA